MDQKTPLFSEDQNEPKTDARTSNSHCIIIDEDDRSMSDVRSVSCKSFKRSKISVSTTNGAGKGTSSKVTPYSKSKNSLYNRKFLQPLRGAVYELAHVDITDTKEKLP